MHYRVRRVISGVDLKVGSVVNAPKWPNLDALVGMGWLEPCDPPAAAAPAVQTPATPAAPPASATPKARSLR